VNSSVRARLTAAGIAFILGFVIANYGILRVPGRDQWLWLAAAVVLMLTGAVGVIIADTRRRISIWAVLGLETLAFFTIVPLLWVFTLATTPEGQVARSVLPTDVSWSVFGDVLDADVLRRAAVTSVLVALIATAGSLLVAGPAVYAMVRRHARGRRVVHVYTAAVLLAPLVAFAGPFGDQLRAFGWYDHRLALALPTLMLTLPLALWLGVTLMRDVPWSLDDALRADGAGRRQRLRWFILPNVAPAVLTVTLLVFLAACNDALIGATLTGSDLSRTLPATLLLAADQLENPTAQLAAAGLLWLVPALLVLLALPRRTLRLLGRTYP
jgi:ABC-type glycerol-3-phosphate transport system permease component